MKHIVAIAWVVIFFQYPPAHPARLIFVEPAGETFTIEEQERTREGVERAIAWWQDLAPAPVNLTITGTTILTTTEDVYHSWGWARPFLADGSPATTIFIIDNSESAHLIFDDSAGETQDYYNMMTLVLSPTLDPDGLAAATAHEMGHLLYHLPHQQDTTDIMNNWLTAYKMRFVGCGSLEKLGAPCKRTLLPMVLQ